MKLLPLIMMTVALSACQPGQVEQPQNGEAPGGRASGTDPGETPDVTPVWRAELTSRCAKGPEEKCPGAYGFRLRWDGGYQIGPGPAGQVITGRLLKEDLAALKSSVLLLTRKWEPAPVADSAKGSCVATASRESTDEVRLGRDGGADQVLLVSNDTETCYFGPAGTESSEGAALHQLLRDLLTKYSPESFPNPCVDASWDFSRLREPYLRCITDSDCAYLDGDLLPVEAGRSGLVLEDDCSYAPPLVVANAFDAVAYQRRLLMERELVRSVCGESLNRRHCPGKQFFDPWSAPPVCSQGKCQVHPGIRYR